MDRLPDTSLRSRGDRSWTEDASSPSSWGHCSSSAATPPGPCPPIASPGPHSPLGGDRKRSRPTRDRDPMAAYCFTDILDRLTPRNYHDLELAYARNDRRLPSKRVLRDLSTAINISQSKIRKWFLQRIHRDETPPVTAAAPAPAVPSPGAAELRIDERLGQLEDRIQLVNNQLGMLEATLQGIQLQLSTALVLHQL